MLPPDGMNASVAGAKHSFVETTESNQAFKFKAHAAVSIILACQGGGGGQVQEKTPRTTLIHRNLRKKHHVDAGGMPHLEVLGLASGGNDARAVGDILPTLQAVTWHERGVPFHQLRTIALPENQKTQTNTHIRTYDA